MAILTDYRGLKVSDLNALRGRLRAVGAEYHVAKNTMTRFAARRLGRESMVADLESGAADLVYNCTLQDYLRLKADKNYNAQLLSPAAGMYQMQPNVTFKPLDDKRVRQALNYAIDRKRITDTVLLGLVGPQDLPWPSNVWMGVSIENRRSSIALVANSG